MEKKRGVAIRLRLFSIGSGRRSGRFGGAVHGVRVVQVFFTCRRFDAVAPAQPAAQVNESAALAAKGPLRPFLRPLSIHRLVADWATYLLHRKPRFRTSAFSRPA